MIDNKLGKQYKLCKKTTIDQIFEAANTVKVFPFVLMFVKTDLDTEKPFQIVISAPKKMHKKAVDRNRIKRLCKESLRLNKAPLESFCNSNNCQLGLFLIFTSKEEMSLDLMNRKMKKLITKLIQQIDE